MANDAKTLSTKIAAGLALGFKLVEVVKMTGTHRKPYFEYKGETFFVTTSSSKSSDQRAMINFRKDLRAIQRAVDTDDQTLKAKYLGQRR